MNEPAIFPIELSNNIINYRLNPKDNWYNTYGKLSAFFSKNEGILVTNDQYDLIMLKAFNIPKKVIQLVHDAYNVELSKKFHPLIDGFVAHNQNIYNQLNLLLPHRKPDIHFRPYGIPINSTCSFPKNKNQNLKLIFIGRHHRSKGVFDLILINKALVGKGINVDWTILGKGPETDLLKRQWLHEKNVKFHLAKDNNEVLTYAFNNDIFVFPTNFEGSPVALLEAMSMGCVPVVTDLEGGISETIKNDENGFKCRMNQIEDFVQAIEKLHYNRNLMYQIQEKCRHTIISKFNINTNTNEYIKLFQTYADSIDKPLHHNITSKIGSRLDQPWIPSLGVLFLRKSNPFLNSKFN
jgi:glycosyltransferase involved in cell wall biosynthesis